MADIYTMELTPRFFRVSLGGKSADIDPLRANAAIADIQEKHGMGSDTSIVIAEWLADQLGIEASAVDCNSAIEFTEAVVTVAAAMVEQRKKKRFPTANSLLTSLGYQEISATGPKPPAKAGSQTSTRSKPKNPSGGKRSGLTPSTVSKTRSKRSPAAKKKAKTKR